MKKTILIGVILLFALTGCFEKDVAVNNKGNVDNKISKNENKKQEDIKDWLKAGQGVECTVKTEQGTVKTYSRGKKIRTEGVGFDPKNPKEVGYMISDGEWTYFWSGEKGTKMNEKLIDKMNADSMGNDDKANKWDVNTDDWDKQGVDYSCKKSKFRDDIFKAPQDVKFTDTSAMLKASTEINQNLNQNFGNMDDMKKKLNKELNIEELQKKIKEMNGEK